MNLPDRATTIEPRLTWEETKEGLKGTYCGPAKATGKVTIVSGTIKNASILNSKELIEQIHNLSTALRNRVHSFSKGTA